jgi:hypothetical protein
MKDLQFIVLSDSLSILTKSELANQASRTIKIESDGNLSYTKKVVINGFSIFDFTIVTSTTLYVRPPSQLDGVTLGEMDITIYSHQLTDPGEALLDFDLTNRFTAVTGSQKLAQQVLKTLITTAQTNRFNEAEGGSLTDVLGGSINPEGSAQVASAVSRAIADTKRFYTETQTNSDLPFDERLLDLTLSSVEFDSTTLEVKAKLRLTTFSGTSEVLPIIL